MTRLNLFKSKLTYPKARVNYMHKLFTLQLFSYKRYTAKIQF